MKCEECVAAGQKSTIHIGQSYTTAMWSSPYYDEDGKYHHHDLNNTTTTLTCSKGHTWKSVSRPRWMCCERPADTSFGLRKGE